MNMMRARHVTRGWRPGSREWGWWREALDLWRREPVYMWRLTWSIRYWGMIKPVLLGDDLRVWDGHHRIVAARCAGRPVAVSFGGMQRAVATWGKGMLVDESTLRHNPPSS